MTITTMIDNNRLTEAGLRLAARRVQASVSSDTMTGKNTTGLSSCLMDCAESVHYDNRQRGWWSNLETGEPVVRNVGELLMLMVSELAEIPEAPQTMILMDDKLPDRLMFEVELADAAIRILDTAGALAPKFHHGYVDGCKKVYAAAATPSVDALLMTTVRHLSSAMEDHRKGRQHGEIPGFDYWLGRALHNIFFTGHVWGLQVADAMCEKLAYNRTRVDHSVEHRRTEGGKKF